MFIALNESGERVEIRDAVKNNKYFCPVCGEPLTIRAADSLAVKCILLINEGHSVMIGHTI